MHTFTEKIYTPQGITKENIFTNGEKVLHIGSGSRVLQGAQTVDILPLSGVDLVHDLDVFPWPYEDASFDLVYAHNVFEHLEDLVGAMNEVWRILKPQGRLVVTVPYFRSVDAFADPTHEHFFTSRTMDCFADAQSNIGAYGYTQKYFKKIGFWYGWPQKSRNPLRNFFKKFIHTHHDFYDSHLSLLLPADVLIWELEVVK